MKRLKSIFLFYIDSSIHVALAVVALTCITYLEFNITLNVNVLCFVFLASVTGYNFVKYFGLARFHHRRLTNKLKSIQIFSAIVFGGLLFFFLKLEWYSQLLIFGLGLVTFLYAIPFLPKRFFLDEQQNLRQISGLKVYVIALVWTLSTVILPLINSGNDFGSGILIVCVQRFLFVIVLMLPFEIRDLNYDSLKLSTIPQVIGVSNTKILGFILLVVFLVLEFLKTENEKCHLIATLFIIIIIGCFLAFSRKQQGLFYASFWVESLPIWWLLAALIFH